MARRMSSGFAGKTAFVTGGTGGIGWSTALALHDAGARVAICGRAGDGLERARARISDNGLAGMLALEADVSSQTDIARAGEILQERFDHLDILVNNAGIDSFQRLDAFSPERFGKVMDVNVTSVFLVISQVLPLLRAARSASIVTIGSIHGHITTAGRSDYVASKSALVGATRALALDLAPDRIRINLVSPGAIETPMLLRGWAVKAPDADPETLKAKAGALHPCGRIGTPEDVASAVMFLVGDEAGFITGTEILVDGGMSCRLAMTALWDE